MVDWREPQPGKVPEDLPLRQDTWNDRQIEELEELTADIAEREKEAMRCHRALPYQEEFHRSKAKTRIIRGGNRSGKSVSGFVEVARAALGVDPYGKYPEPPLNIHLVGWDEKHIGRNIHRLLFEPGAFSIIRDAKTKKWRAYRPWYPGDWSRKDERVKAPPLIPKRLIDPKGWAWKKKGIKCFEVCRLKNGSELWAFSSKGDAPRGDKIDLADIDEDVRYPHWITELSARCVDNDAPLIWQTLPYSRNDVLLSMSQMAADQVGMPNPEIVEFVWQMSNNRYLSGDAKRRLKNLWGGLDERELAMRDRGEFGYGESIVYPSFHIDIHGMRTESLPGRTVPHHWTRYAVIDPGRQVCAVLFIAVAPPKEGDFALIYDELYLQQTTAHEVAINMARKLAGQPQFRAFIIDDHGSRPTESTGKTIYSSYSQEFQSFRVSCELTGSGFLLGDDDIPGRIEAVRLAMRQRAEGTPFLRMLRETTPHMQRELQRYRFQTKEDGTVLDKPNYRGLHLVACLEYAFAYKGLKYFTPTPGKRPLSVAERILAERAAKKQALESNVVYC